MNFYLIEEEKPKGGYGYFSHLGTWSRKPLCESCGQPQSVLVEPLIAQWEPDSDVIGDFSWCGYVAAVVESVRGILQEEGVGAQYSNIEYEEPEKKPKRKEIVTFPYVGPKQYWLRPTSFVSVNLEKSGIELVSDCNVCGNKKYTFKRDGLFIDSVDWDGSRLFRIEQFGRSRAMFVTEDLKNVFETYKLSNVAFSLAGKIE